MVADVVLEELIAEEKKLRKNVFQLNVQIAEQAIAKRRIPTARTYLENALSLHNTISDENYPHNKVEDDVQQIRACLERIDSAEKMLARVLDDSKEVIENESSSTYWFIIETPEVDYGFSVRSVLEISPVAKIWFGHRGRSQGKRLSECLRERPENTVIRYRLEGYPEETIRYFLEQIGEIIVTKLGKETVRGALQEYGLAVINPNTMN